MYNVVYYYITYCNEDLFKNINQMLYFRTFYKKTAIGVSSVNLNNIKCNKSWFFIYRRNYSQISFLFICSTYIKLITLTIRWMPLLSNEHYSKR